MSTVVETGEELELASAVFSCDIVVEVADIFERLIPDPASACTSLLS